jgi:putative lipoprotein
MITRAMLLAVLGALTTSACTTPASEQVASAAAVTLTNTNWRLTQLAGQLVDNPAGGNAIGFQLDAQNPRMTGFAGCNRMFGAYVLGGDALKFDQVGSTKMACLEGDRMQLENRFTAALMQVARWKITGEVLELLDPGGNPLASFAASAAR